MQFELFQKVGDTKTFVVFYSDFISLKKEVKDSLIQCFNKLGGKLNQNGEWMFPIFISAQTLQEVINNTCFECGGLMKDSTALDNTYVTSIDFPGETNLRGCTQSKIGYPVMKNVRKCSSCGHSHT